MSRSAGAGGGPEPSDKPPGQSDLRAAAVHGLRWAVIARPAIEIVSLAAMVVLARLIPPAEFGRWAIAIIVQELALMMAGEGVGTALVQRKVATRRHLRAGIALSLIAGTILAALVFTIAAVLITPLFGGRTADFVRLSTPLFLMAGVSTVPLAILRRRLAFRTLALIDLVTAFTRSGACVALAVAGFEGEALVLGGLAAAFVGMSVAVASAPPPLPRLYRQEARDILGYGIPAALAAVSGIGFRNCDYAIVGARLGVIQAGFYFRAYTLAVDYQSKVSAVMTQVGFPVLSRTADGGQMATMRAQMVRLLTILLFPLLAGLAVVAPVLVPFVFGDAWAPAIVPTQILALGGAAALVINTIVVTLMASGRPRALLAFGWAQFVTYAGAVFVASHFGLAAVAAAAASVQAIFLVVGYSVMLRGSPGRSFRQLWTDIAPATVSSGAAMAVALPASLTLSAEGVPALAHLLVVALAAAPVYLIALRMLFPGTWQSLWTLVRQVLPIGRLRTTARRFAPARARSMT